MTESGAPQSTPEHRSGSEIEQQMLAAIHSVELVWSSANDVERAVLSERLALGAQATLDDIGRQHQLSRERIRQLEKQLRQRISDALSGFLQAVVGPIEAWAGDFITQVDLEFAVALVSGGTDDVYSRVISKSIHDAMHFTCEGGRCVSERGREAIQQLGREAERFANNYGLVDEDALRAEFDSGDWQESWDDLIAAAGLTRICGFLTLRQTRQAQVAAALMSLGRPARRSEIEDVLHDEFPGQRFRVDAVLTSMSTVVRASKTEWGFEHWVDDVYEGIPAEIMQRISEDGGSTRLSRLLEELPRKFGVKETSVKAYVDSPAFRLEHGWVSVASEPEMPLGQLDDVISGRDAAGDAYWDFEIEDRHLHGYSLTAVPPEIVVRLGCTFGESTLVTVRSPRSTGSISVIWRASSITGPEIGRIRHALQALRVDGGSTVRLVLHSDGGVSFARPQDMPIVAHMGASQSPLRSISAGALSQSTSYSGVKIGRALAGRLKSRSQETRTGSPNAVTES